MLIVIVLAHFRHNESMRTFLSHLRTQKMPHGCRLKILVHDNSSDFHNIGANDLDISVYSTGENLHYLGGCWRALQAWHAESGVWPEWAIVANHDLVFEERFFEKLLHAPIGDAVGLVAPDVRLRDGVAQNPFLKDRPSRISMQARAIAFRYSMIYRILETKYRLRMRLAAMTSRLSPPARRPGVGDQHQAIEIYAAHGCALLIHRAFFERGGSLASKSTAFHEEFLVAERCRRLGLKALWLPALHVVHHENTTMRLAPRTLQMHWMRRLSENLLSIYDDGEAESWFPNPPRA